MLRCAENMHEKCPIRNRLIPNNEMLFVTKFTLVIALFLSLVACGGGSSGSSDEPEDVVATQTDDTPTVADPVIMQDPIVTEPDSMPIVALDTAVTFRVAGELPDLVDGFAPEPSTDNNRPEVFSAPNSVAVVPASSVQVELAYTVTTPLRALYVGQENANGYLTFNLPADDGDTSTQAAVVFTVDLPDADEARCYEFSVEDLNALVSDTSSICVEPFATPGADDQRVIFFADFSDESTLSTLSLDSGDVQQLGNTGVSLTDIAFSGLSLFGTNGDELIDIDPDTGASQVIGLHGGVTGANALVGFDGLLYSANIGGQIFSIDPETLQTEQLGMIPGGFSSGDLVVDPLQENLLFGTAIVLSESSDVLYTFDIDTGEAVIIGETGFNNVFGLAIFRDQLVGLTDQGEFILIDRASGRSALVSQNSTLSAGGATVAVDTLPVF